MDYEAEKEMLVNQDILVQMDHVGHKETTENLVMMGFLEREASQCRGHISV